VVFLAAVAISHAIAAPIKRLQKAALALGRGAVKQRVKVSGCLELKDLASAFNAMAGEIGVREEALRESEQHFRNLADSGMSLIWTSGTDKRCNYFNEPWLSFTGRTLEQELGEGWAEGVHPEDLERCLEIYTSAFDRRERFSLIYRLRRHDGAYRWIQDDGTPRYDSNGRFIGYIGHCLDITEHKQTEETLHRYVLMATHSKDIILFLQRDDGRIMEVNTAAVNAYGYSREELLALKVHDLRAPGTHGFISDQMAEADARGILFETIHQRKDGATFPVEVSSRGVTIGRTRTLISVVRDITERKRVEEGLRRVEGSYRSLFENMLDGFAYCRMIFEHNQPQDFQYLAVNRRFEELTGLGNVIGKKVTEVMPRIRESHPELFEIYGRVALTGHPERFEFYVEQLERWFFVSAYSLKEGYFYAVFDNITERKRVEAALVKSEARYRAVVEDQTELITRFSPEGIVTFVNQANCRFFGMREDEFVGRTFWHLVPEEDHDRIKELIGSLNAEQPTGLVEHRAVTADGEIRWTQWINRAIFDDLGRIVEYQGVGRDVTSLKLAQETLQETTRRLQLATASGHLGVWDWDVQSNELVWDDRMFELYGIAEESSPMGIEVWQNALHPDDRGMAIEATQAALRGEKEYDIEFRIFHPDGTIKVLSANALVIRDEGGKPVRMIGLNRDIT
jgi:PAS domain S-box-containing protein